MTAKRIVTYNEYSELLNLLVYKLRRDERIKRIKTVYGIPRGGLPIAIHLSHAMGWEFTNNPFHDHYENTIIVDDIADTGVTLKKCGNLYAFVWERCISLSANHGFTGMIQPVAAVCTEVSVFSS